MGFDVKAKVGYMGENISDGRIRNTRKEVVGCVHAIVGKNILLVQFRYDHNK